MSLTARATKLDTHLQKREAACFAYLRQVDKMPEKKQRAFMFFFAERAIELGWLPPLPDGCQSLQELRVNSKADFEAYVGTCREKLNEEINRPSRSTKVGLVLTIKNFDQWSAFSGDKF